MRRRLAQDRFPIGAEVEQYIAFRGDRIAVEGRKILRADAIVDVLNLEQRSLGLIRVEGVEPTGDREALFCIPRKLSTSDATWKRPPGCGRSVRPRRFPLKL
jgi:hypothetical protein